MKRLSLAGRWRFRLDEDDDWLPIDVPACWEALGVRKDRPGPAWYRTEVLIPESFAGRRVWLRFEGVSYHCSVRVNGIEVGSHTGMWDAFGFEVTDAVTPGGVAEILVKVEKPASLKSGPSSPAVSGNFPLRETLAGFLPYVWGHCFGGIWQDCRLEATGEVVIEGIGIRTDEHGRVLAEIGCSDVADVRLEIIDPTGVVVFSERRRGKDLSFEAGIPKPRLWSPEHPARYRASVLLEGDEGRSVTFGFRSLRVEGSTLLLNGRPLYPRMILSWGWYPESLHSNPGPERVRRDLLRLKELGYNGVKLCLWVPPRYYFELADELGMLLWLELPMWQPQASTFFRRQCPGEYRRIVDQVRHHPSLVIYSLGCELGRGVGEDLLGPLFAEVKSLIGDALLRDNSGSGEAYGGLLNEFADFYDYHFYSDIHFFRNLVDYFTPRWRPEQPWLFGEFCDSDTFRDLRRVAAADGGGMPWWVLKENNPQGARWQFDIVEQENRLRENGFWERGEELEIISRRQALLHRKFTLELVRTYREITGYVVTGERDTPISTAGMWDDSGRVKFDPAAFRTFNRDLVLALGWDKRRAWIAGGDRPAYWDTYSYRQGERVRAHIIASHYGRAVSRAEVTWSASLPGRSPFAEGRNRTSFAVGPGTVRELVVAEFIVPDVEAPSSATLRASVRIGEEETANSWTLWFFPAGAWEGLAPLTLLDPTGRLHGLDGTAPLVEDGVMAPDRVAVATVWTDALEEFVAAGGRAVLLPGEGDSRSPLGLTPLPFWREAIKIIEPHPAWGDFPHQGWVDLQFFGLATDRAFIPPAAGDARPILRRLDARTMRCHDYATELPWGEGRIIASTLRFEGGSGEQPLGIARNIAAAYLLSRWIGYLQR